jgi:hypothetical protein
VGYEAGDDGIAVSIDRVSAIRKAS